MADSKLADDLIQLVVGRIMRGENPDVDGLIASMPDMPDGLRDTLHQIAKTFDADKLDPRATRTRGAMLPFERLGPYRLVSHLGEGGMGMVFLAEHEFLARRVALKIIRPELALSDITRQRFQREAMSIARLRHENIVSVYDAGEHNGVAFLAMELVDGRGLDEMLLTTEGVSGRIDPLTAARHARDIALALQCAHEAGIVHRDVKPSNIRITPDGRARLLDFGLSLADEMASLTHTGQFRGTPQYASPEQVDGGSADIDARTDVYSLGVTLYKCLTGALPFAGATTHQLFQQILVRKPPDPRSLDANVDATLNGIVMRALEKRREDRFDGARDMARALDDWIRDCERARPAAQRGPSRRSRMLAVATIVLAAGATAFIGLRFDADAAAADSEIAQRVPAVVPQRTIAPLGPADVPFGERLNEWKSTLGPGTWGDAEEVAGVFGGCSDCVTLKPYPLGHGCVQVSARVLPIDDDASTALDGRTQGAGIGIELSDGRVLALLMIASGNGYDVRLCELRRDGASGWTRGPEIGAGKGTWAAGQSLDFALSWNDADMQFAWGSADDCYLLPRKLRQGARPRSLVLVVERGHARFDEVIVEES